MDRQLVMESFWLTFPLLILVIVWVIWKVFVFKGLRWLQEKSVDDWPNRKAWQRIWWRGWISYCLHPTNNRKPFSLL